MPPLSQPTTGQSYWRSLEEWADTPAFRELVEREFPSLAPELLTSATRRQFLKLMGASLALGGLAGCRWPKENIVPYADRPKNRTPGVPVQFATALELGGVATGLLVTSYDGRPIKIEGNDRHPFSRGKTNAIQQATILELYDPDRSRWSARRTGASDGGTRTNQTWDAFAAFAKTHFAEVRGQQGAGLGILAEASASPSLLDTKARLLKALPQARWFEYEPLSRDNEREGARLAFGKPYRTHLHLDAADVIVSFDADFLMTHPAAVRYAGDFAARRRADDGTMNRLYVFESNLSVTGSNADHRYPVKSAEIGLVARALQAELGKLLPGLEAPPNAPGDAPVGRESLVAVAQDLVAHKGRSAIVVGPRQPAEVHALAHWLNSALESVGRTVTYTEELEPDRPTHVAAIFEFCRRMQSGEAQTVVIVGGNPVYNAPSDLGFAQALAKVKTSVHLSLYDDETSRLCTWHLPRAHYLESWSDARAYDGTVSLVQPLIEPLYDGKTPIELLALILGDELAKGYDLTRRTFREQFAGNAEFETEWRQALQTGVVAASAWPPVTPAARALAGWEPRPVAAGTFEIVLAEDYRVYDGRFANNGWLQELPDPITKLTWDNGALISPVDAKQLGVERYGDMVRIEHGGRSLDVAAYPLPGHAPGSITLSLGYGRTAAGRVAAGSGVDAYTLMRSAAPALLLGATVTRTGQHYKLATTQDHHAIRSAVGDQEAARRVEQELIRAVTLTEFQQEPKFAQRAHHPLQLWQAWSYDEGHKWGMAIDLSACIGCSACVAACQAENNIPVVGKSEVARGREMHWIRVDRYFKGQPEGPHVEVVYQPMTCHHCENAPCEGVCPVAATVHDKEGLNVQVYNRCIGTRYCNNNCPFKVRRFNWFYNHHGPKHPRHGERLTDIEKMVFNPDVTVRSRGVMEKCTFCVQRINAVKITARNEGWAAIPDGAITPACAQACPTDAIVFGDLNDPQSRVRKLYEHHRSYELLEGLNLRSRLHYLAKLRNPASTPSIET